MTAFDEFQSIARTPPRTQSTKPSKQMKFGNSPLSVDEIKVKDELSPIKFQNKQQSKKLLITLTLSFTIMRVVTMKKKSFLGWIEIHGVPTTIEKVNINKYRFKK